MWPVGVVLCCMVAFHLILSSSPFASPNHCRIPKRLLSQLMPSMASSRLRVGVRLTRTLPPKSEEQNGGTKNQFAEAMLVYTTCRIIIPLWNHVLDVQGSHGSFRSIPRFFHHDVLHPLSDQDFTPEVLRQFASEKWQDSWPHPGVKGELHGQHHPAIVWPPNHVLLQNHLLAKLSAALQLIHHRYNSSHILTPIGPSVRHVQLLETQLGKMDQHYDECNSAMATGEVNGYDDKFLS